MRNVIYIYIRDVRIRKKLIIQSARIHSVTCDLNNNAGVFFKTFENFKINKKIEIMSE